MRMFLIILICISMGAIARPDDRIAPDPIAWDLGTREGLYEPDDLTDLISTAACGTPKTGSDTSIPPAPASNFFDIFRKRDMLDSAIAFLNRGSSPSDRCVPRTISPPDVQSGKAKRPGWATVCDKAKLPFAVCCRSYPVERPNSRRNFQRSQKTFDLEGCDRSKLLFSLFVTSLVPPIVFFFSFS